MLAKGKRLLYVKDTVPLITHSIIFIHLIFHKASNIRYAFCDKNADISVCAKAAFKTFTILEKQKEICLVTRTTN